MIDKQKKKKTWTVVGQWYQKKKNKKNINEIADYKQGSLVGCSSSTVSKAFVITNSKSPPPKREAPECHLGVEQGQFLNSAVQFRVSLLENEKG